MNTRRLRALAVGMGAWAAMAGVPGLADQPEQPKEGASGVASPGLLPPRFGPRGVRIQPPAGSEFGQGNMVVGGFDIPGWAEEKAGRALPSIADAEVAAVVGMLDGSYASAAMSEGGVEIPALVMGMGRIDVIGLDNAVYFEVARADSHWQPYRQGVLHVYRGGEGSGLRVRVFALGGVPTQADAVAGLWIAPEIFPDVTVDSLRPLADITLAKSGETYQGQSGRFPVQMGPAMEAEMGIEIGNGRVAMSDRAFDATGRQVSGLPAGKAVTFQKAPSKTKVTKREDGLYIIDLVPPIEGVTPVATEGSSARVALHYTGWLYSDGTKFASSRDARWDHTPVEPQMLNMTAKLLSGWSKGLPGVTKGTRRKLIMPSGMAFHSVGSPNWRVPPNTPLIFDFECMWIEDKPADPPSEPGKPDEPSKGDEGAGTGAGSGK